MKQAVISLHVYLVIFMFPLFATAQNRAGELDKYFSSLARNGAFNGNILVPENGKVIYENHLAMPIFQPND